MDELKAKVCEVKEEWNQTIFAFTEYTGGVLKRADEFINADRESANTLHDSMNVLLADLSEVIRKCKSMRSTIENRPSLATDSALCSVTASSLSEVLREVNPSIFETGSYAASTEGVRLGSVFSGDDHHGNLPNYKTVVGNDPEPASTQPEDDNPPPYSQLSVTPGYPTGAFDFSSGLPFGNLFSVKLNFKSVLTKDTRTKLDNVLSTFFPSAAFKREDASFKPPCNGVYAINVELCQYGHGEMDVWLCSRGHVSYVGKTKGHMLETSVMKVKMLTEGQDHWVEVRALKGGPSVYWCNFSGFLLAKSPSSAFVAAAPL